jgi:hypothetical protein
MYSLDNILLADCKVEGGVYALLGSVSSSWLFHVSNAAKKICKFN